MTKEIKFPLWFTVLTVLLILSNFLAFGLFSLIHPELPWPGLGKTEAAFPIEFFAIRHIAFAIPLFHGLVKKNVTILITCYTIFMVVAILDISLLAIKGYYVPMLVRLTGELSLIPTLLISIFAFLVPMFFALRYLKSQKIDTKN